MRVSLIAWLCFITILVQTCSAYEAANKLSVTYAALVHIFKIKGNTAMMHHYETLLKQQLAKENGTPIDNSEPKAAKPVGKTRSGPPSPAPTPEVLKCRQGWGQKIKHGKPSGCFRCGAGFYGGGGTDSCKKCPAGRFGRGGSVAPKCSGFCPAGKFSQHTGSATCKACTMGQFQHSPGMSRCITCPWGQVTSSTATGCTPMKGLKNKVLAAAPNKQESHYKKVEQREQQEQEAAQKKAQATAAEEAKERAAEQTLEKRQNQKETSVYHTTLYSHKTHHVKHYHLHTGTAASTSSKSPSLASQAHRRSHSSDSDHSSQPDWASRQSIHVALQVFGETKHTFRSSKRSELQASIADALDIPMERVRVTDVSDTSSLSFSSSGDISVTVHATVYMRKGEVSGMGKLEKELGQSDFVRAKLVPSMHSHGLSSLSEADMRILSSETQGSLAPGGAAASYAPASVSASAPVPGPAAASKQDANSGQSGARASAGAGAGGFAGELKAVLTNPKQFPLQAGLLAVGTLIVVGVALSRIFGARRPEADDEEDGDPSSYRMNNKSSLRPVRVEDEDGDEDDDNLENSDDEEGNLLGDRRPSV